MRQYWFRRKLYGWGWTPATWQGWTILVVWLALFVLGEIVFMQQLKTDQSLIVFGIFFMYVLVLVVSLMAVCYKTGEKPRWQWGKDEDE